MKIAYFNNVSLSSVFGVRILRRVVHPIPPRAISAGELANDDGAKLVSANYKAREIVIEGDITRNLRSQMEDSRDLLLALLTPTEAPLELDQSGVRRKYTATVSNIIFSEAKGGYLPFSITFLCSDPFGYNTTPTAIALGAAVTTFYSEKTFNILGSIYALPAITVIVNTHTGTTSNRISLTNPDTGEVISIDRDWTNADSLVVDCANRTVKVNGTAVNYIGKFPKYNPKIGNKLVYQDDFTARNVTLQFSYTKRWL